MNLSNANLSASRHSGKLLFTTMMFIFVLVILVVFLGFSGPVSALSRYDKAEAQLAGPNSLKAATVNPKIGVINGIVYSPSCPSALVDTTTVHEGDKIHDVVVVSIHRSSVEFAKNGVTWQQTVLDKPNAFWTTQVK